MYLQVKSVSKRFGSVEAVKDVSFHCARGELVSLLGPSGCGKTTTLRLLAGFEPPDSGAVFLDGASLEGVPPEGRGVGIVFQNYALFPHMSVGANITYGLRFVRPRLSAAEKAERLQELLELVDLAGYADRRPDQLSAGQQQRVAIARALAPKPRLLLLDEPLSALDAGLREQLRFQIRRIQQALGLTTVYVTHDQAEALAISDQVVIMREGRVAQAAPPREIYERPADRFVAQFVGGASLIPVRELAGFDGKAAPGDLAVLRAEAVSPHPPFPGAPSLSGRLAGAEYLGHTCRLQVETPAGTVWAAAPGAELEHWRSRQDQTVRLHFDPASTPTVPGDEPSLTEEGRGGQTR